MTPDDEEMMEDLRRRSRRQAKRMLAALLANFACILTGFWARRHSEFAMAVSGVLWLLSFVWLATEAALALRITLKIFSRKTKLGPDS